MNFEAYRQIKRRQCRDSFWEFLLTAFGAKYNPKGKRWLDPEIHKPLCDWFQEHITKWIEARKHGKGYPLYLLVLVPRDVGKTTTITQAGLLWTHLLDPDISTYIGSERIEFAVDILDPLKTILNGDDGYSQFTWLYGNWYHPDRTWNQKFVVHAARANLARKEPSFGVWGVESGITGKHPDLLCLDDPTSYEKMAAYGSWLQYVNDHIDSLIPVLPSDGCLIFVGTRYHDADHFGRAIDKGKLISVSGMENHGYTTQEDGKWHMYYLSARDADGKVAIPSVWSERRLRDYQYESPLKYSAQVLNNPMNDQFNLLPLERLHKYIVEDDHIPNNIRISFHIDTAFNSEEKKARGDHTVLVEMGHGMDRTGTVYFLDAHGSADMSAEQFRDMLLARYQYWRRQGKKIVLITDEATIGKEGAFPMLMQTWFAGINQPCPPIEEIRRINKKKVMRHAEAAQFILEGKVFFRRSAVGLDTLFKQLSRIGVSDHDDYIDAFSDTFHPRCYNVMSRIGSVQGPDEPVRYPWDAYLKGNYQEALRDDLDQYLGY